MRAIKYKILNLKKMIHAIGELLIIDNLYLIFSC